MRNKEHLLFVCTSNLDRSPCAESLFESNEEYEAKSCGLFPHAEIQISKSLISWADIIFVMDERNEQHKTQLLKRFPEAWDKSIIILNIPNTYCRNDPELLSLLKQKLKDFLGEERVK